jgi:hypothetical protein
MRILIAAAVLAAAPALGQTSAPVCSPYASLVADLAQEWDERPVARGIDERGAVVELIAAADGASWTILVIGPHGVACIATHGRAWRVVLPGAPS